MSGRVHRISIGLIAMGALAFAVILWGSRLESPPAVPAVPPELLPRAMPSDTELMQLRQMVPRDPLVAGERIELAELPAPVQTDRGRPIPLYRPRKRKKKSDADAFAARREVERILKLVRVGEHDGPCNCHGWVFTEGRYWMEPDHVAMVIADNGYQSVDKPRPGDVVLYVDDRGGVVHTGVVRLVRTAGIRIESQWGGMGRYMHDVAAQIYSRHCTYLRSPRDGHLLRGLPPRPE